MLIPVSAILTENIHCLIHLSTIGGRKQQTQSERECVTEKCKNTSNLSPNLRNMFKMSIECAVDEETEHSCHDGHEE